MLPYQYCKEEDEGREERMVIGPGMDTQNMSRNRQYVWSGILVGFTLICVNICIWKPQAKCIGACRSLECSSNILYSKCVNPCGWE